MSELAVEMKAIAVEEINREEVKWNGAGGVSWSRDAVRSCRTGFGVKGLGVRSYRTGFRGKGLG